MVSVADKIRKLLALAESPNENEATAAMMKAQELMVKHKLTQREVEDITPEKKQSVVVGRTDIRFRQAKWKAVIAKIIAENFLCNVVASTGAVSHSSTIVFIGLEDDVDTCAAVYEYAIKFIGKNASRIKKSYYDAGRSAKGVESCYAFGFAKGLQENYARQVANNSEFGLVLVKDERVDEAMHDMGTVSRSLKISEPRAGYESYIGYKDGLSFSTADRLSEGVTNDQRY